MPEEQHNIFMIVMVSYFVSIGYENKYHDRKIGHIVVTLYNQKETQKIYDYQNKPIMYNLDRIVVYMRLRRSR